MPPPPFIAIPSDANPIQNMKSPTSPSFPSPTFRRKTGFVGAPPLFPDPGRWPRPPPVPKYRSDCDLVLLSRSSDSDMSEISEQGDISGNGTGSPLIHASPSPVEATPEVASQLIEKLACILPISKSRKALRNLKGARGQLMVDYLYSVLQQPSPPSLPWLQKHTLIALYKLSKTSLLYPLCYVLRDIVFDSHEGGGGFSDIHKGHYGDQQVCLKVIRLHKKSETDAMLKIYAKEAILWGQLHHHNIVPFYGIYYLNEARKQICLVSPWMHNGNLVDFLESTPEVPRAPFVHDIVAGLDYLHSRSLVHGDLKGANVLVNDSGIACITDFGLSRIRTDQTLAYTIAATTAHGFSYHWAAPELLDDNAQATTASDIWALGCVYYEVLTGKAPFHGLSDAQIIRKLDRGILPSRPDLSEVTHMEYIVWKLVGRCWMREARDRPRSDDILRELESHGLVRGVFNTEQHEHALKERRNFEEAMRKGREMPVDLIATGGILDDIRNT